MDFLSALSDDERQVVEQTIATLGAKAESEMKMTMVNKCFNMCVTSFKSRTLDRDERVCISNCAVRFLKAMDRVGMRFAEENSNMMNAPPQ